MKIHPPLSGKPPRCPCPPAAFHPDGPPCLLNPVPHSRFRWDTAGGGGKTTFLFCRLRTYSMEEKKKSRTPTPPKLCRAQAEALAVGSRPHRRGLTPLDKASLNSSHVQRRRQKPWGHPSHCHIRQQAPALACTSRARPGQASLCPRLVPPTHHGPPQDQDTGLALRGAEGTETFRNDFSKPAAGSEVECQRSASLLRKRHPGRQRHHPRGPLGCRVVT